jgi:hypothetical protein
VRLECSHHSFVGGPVCSRRTERKFSESNKHSDQLAYHWTRHGSGHHWNYSGTFCLNRSHILLHVDPQLGKRPSQPSQAACGNCILDLCTDGSFRLERKYYSGFLACDCSPESHWEEYHKGGKTQANGDANANCHHCKTGGQSAGKLIIICAAAIVLSKPSHRRESSL